ncbi:MAG: tRNA (adenosine(37)-N6)-dimethylallyltransferase MiaA [Candidatus Doudnabacteria bacterium]|nr:tRNA (adenosine(37)-N6)-dimethylallyltransferase MiaA [Candidatus Doudnabacteria bacterium]
MPQESQKLIVVIGPTASGKSEFAVELAQQHNGEIISADSRQVYRGLDIGTGKVEGAWILHPDLSLQGGDPATTKQSTEPHTATSRLPRRLQSQSPRNDGKTFVYKNIPHHCIDYVDPNYQYSVADFKRDAETAITDIMSRGKTPILCGGTGQFVDAVVFNQEIPSVKPDPAFRKTLEGTGTAELFALLHAQDPKRAAGIDPHNPRRLIRALEIIHATGKPVPSGAELYKSYTSYKSYSEQDLEKDLPIEIHYLNPPREELFQKIETRFYEWIAQGLIQEVKELHASKLTWERIQSFGLEYMYISKYLQGTITHEEMIIRSIASIKHYAKRQQTWFKKYIPISIQK